MRKLTPGQASQIQERSYVDAVLALQLGDREILSLPAQLAETTFLNVYPPPDQDIWNCQGKHTETNLRLRKGSHKRSESQGEK